MTALHTLGILSTSFTWKAFPTVLKEFPHMLSTCSLIFLHTAVQLIPNHNWVEVSWLWRPGLLMQHCITLLLCQISLTQPGGVFWVIALFKNKMGIPCQLHNWTHSTKMCLPHLTQPLWSREVWGAAIINIHVFSARGTVANALTTSANQMGWCIAAEYSGSHSG